MTERSNSQAALSNGTRKPTSMAKWTRALKRRKKWLVIPLLAIGLVVVVPWAWKLLQWGVLFILFIILASIPRTNDNLDDFPDSQSWGQTLQRSNPVLVPQWTPDGSHIVFTGIASVNVVSADGSELWRLSESEDKREIDHSPSISPDGTRIAYATSRLKTPGSPRDFEIETSTLDGSDRLRLTERPYTDTSPVWSPDGSRIAFLVGEESSWEVSNGGIYTLAPDGSDIRPVVVEASLDPLSLPDEYHIPSVSLGTGPVWSPDGERIAFTVDLRMRTVDDSYGREFSTLYTVARDGSDLTPLFPRTLDGSASAPLFPWSMDGSSLAELFPGNEYNLLYVSQPSWSPDGRLIAFGAGEYVSKRWEAVGRWETGLYTVGADGSDLRKLPDIGFVGVSGPSWSPIGFVGASGPTWSPDGSKILFSVRRSGDYVTYVVNSDGSGRREVGSGSHASWSPDGSRIVVLDQVVLNQGGRETGAPYLYTMAPDGSDLQVLVRKGEDGNLELASR